MDLLPLFGGDEKARNEIAALRMARELWMEERMRVLPAPDDSAG